VKVICPYCDNPAELVDGTTVYPHRPDLGHLKFWNCAPCNAYVGTHKNSRRHKPLGRLANAELRNWKGFAHGAFDPLWETMVIRDNIKAVKARGRAYKWLAAQLEIDIKDCHIGMFDVAMCKRVVGLCHRTRVIM